MQKSLSIRNSVGILAIGFLLFGAFIVSSNIVVKSSIDDIDTQWQAFDQGPAQKSALLNDLRQAIGLGGVVHQFQSFILRKDRILLINIAAALRQATVAIITYKNLEVNSDEAAALERIESALLLYQENVELAEKMAAQNQAPNVIDRAVNIDDSQILLSLSQLDQQIKQMRQTSSSTISATVSAVATTLSVSSVATVILVLACAVFMILMLRNLLKQIGAEPRRMLAIVKRIANGDLSERLESASGKNRGIYKAMQVMQSNLKEQIDADRQAANENSRLRQALDNASSNVFVVDAQHRVIYTNGAAQRLFDAVQSDIRSQVSHFDIKDLVGFDVNQLKTTTDEPLGADSLLEDDRPHEVEFGKHTFSVIISPIFNDNHEHLGSVLEWVDRTIELEVQKEIQGVVDAASAGDLSQRIDMSGKSGFFAVFSTGMNELVAVNESVLADIQRILESMSSGNLDVRMDAEYKGAFARLKDNFNSTVAQLSQIISEMKSGVNALGHSSEHVISIGDELGKTVSSSSRQATEAANAANSVSMSIDTVAAATVQLTSSTQGINQNVSDAVLVAREAVTIAESADDNVRKLIASSSAIGGITKVITSIAEQTNLLALNATIEAARAGESGKGFAVVANEVKELAKETSKATEEIDGTINTIQRNTEDAARAIGEIARIVKQINDYQESVVAAVEQQTATTGEISRSIQDAATGSTQIARSIAHVAKDSETVQANADQASQAARELDALSAKLNGVTNRFRLSGS